MSHPDQLPISIIILVHEENGILSQSLASASFAQEIIIIDNDSHINWEDYNSFKPRVYSSPNIITDFAHHRNQALSLAHNEWVLFLDSDEVLEKNALRKIEPFLNKNDVAAVSMKRRDIFKGQSLKHGESQQQLVRLFKKNLTRFERTVHEVAVADGHVENSSIEITHYAHNSISSFLASVNRYAELEAQYRFNQQQNTNLFELIFFPIGKWLYNGIIKLGLLDGWAGIVYLTMMSLHSFFVRARLLELHAIHAKNI